MPPSAHRDGRLERARVDERHAMAALGYSPHSPRTIDVYPAQSPLNHARPSDGNPGGARVEPAFGRAGEFTP